MFLRRRHPAPIESQAELIATVPAELRQRLADVVESVPTDFGSAPGGLTKALTSAALIQQYELESYVEIGVYRGRSLLPVAAVFAAADRGSAIGIDPWEVTAATQQDLHLFPEAAATVNEFVRSLDWEAMFADVGRRIVELGLAEHCTLLRARASQVTDAIPDASVGLLHIDGNHDEASVLADLENYLPKMQPGGFVMLDDAAWESVGVARAVLERSHRFLFVDEANDFAVYAVG
ncbi:MAG: hypothetical protein JWO63_2162 [Frankiales bacterium]|jgi:hypothetical protein|nr:hypothetical protein [Frankiales bacterium]